METSAIDGWRLSEFGNRVGEKFVPTALRGEELRGKSFGSVCWKILNAAVVEQLNNRNGRPDVRPDTMFGKQVFYFRYSDGSPMLTVGWLFYSHADAGRVERCGMNGSFFKQDDEALQIEAPKLTPKEIRHLNSRLPDGPPIEAKAIGELCEATGITEGDINKFAAFYRYYPQYSEIVL
jgi:hypothetical protein